jgi:hypothetical protein
LSAEYEEFWLSAAKFQVGVVDDSVLNPRPVAHYVFRFGDEWSGCMTKYEDLPRLDCVTGSQIDFIESLSRKLHQRYINHANQPHTMTCHDVAVGPTAGQELLLRSELKCQLDLYA